MRVVAKFELKDLPEVSFVYGFGAPMYLKCRSRFCTDMVVEALRNDGFLQPQEAAGILALASGLGGLDYLASISPYAWRVMAFLHGFTQDKGFGGMMAVPMVSPSLVLAGVASLEGAGVDVVGVEAWLLPRRSLFELLRVAERVVKRLVLFFRGGVLHVYDSLVLGARPESRFALRDLGLYRTGFDESNLSQVGSGEGDEIMFNEYGCSPGETYSWRRRDVDLLGEAFGGLARAAREVLEDIIDGGGSTVLKSVLEFVKEDRLYLGVFHKLLDYGYLRLAGVPPQVVITEKGLYALRKH